MRYMVTDPYRFRVINNTVMVKEIPEQELVNGLYIVKSENKRQFMAKGEVIHSAPNVQNREGKVLYDLPLERGDKVLYDDRAIQYRIKWNEEMFFIIRAEDVYCVVG